MNAAMSPLLPPPSSRGATAVLHHRIRARGYRSIWQAGTTPGFYSLCVAYPDVDMGIVILANELDRSSAHTLTAIANGIMTAIEPHVVPLP
jgi:hypothetical protein